MSAPGAASGAKPGVRIDVNSILLAAQSFHLSDFTIRQIPWHSPFSALAQGETWQKPLLLDNGHSHPVVQPLPATASDGSPGGEEAKCRIINSQIRHLRAQSTQQTGIPRLERVIQT
jgi:hypothetical protein